LRIVDGDTIDVDLEGKKTRVRLIGVDTPEISLALKQRFGKEAKLFLKNVLQGERVYLEYDDAQARLDRFGRTLAYVYRAPDGMFANLELVRQGYAQVFRKFNFKFKDSFLEQEQLAKQKGKGIWDPDLAGDLSLPSQPIASDAARAPPVVAATQTSQIEITVYVTRTGAKYHRDGCRHLAHSKIPMSLKDAKARYTPCKTCHPPE
jgi:micrococcal nuclease